MNLSDMQRLIACLTITIKYVAFNDIPSHHLLFSKYPPAVPAVARPIPRLRFIPDHRYKFRQDGSRRPLQHKIGKAGQWGLIGVNFDKDAHIV